MRKYFYYILTIQLLIDIKSFSGSSTYWYTMALTMVTYREDWNIAFKTSKPPWKVWKYKINIVYLKKNKFNRKRKGSQYCIILFYSKDLPTFNELVIKNSPIKKYNHFRFYWRVSPTPCTSFFMKRKNPLLQCLILIQLCHNNNFNFN